MALYLVLGPDGTNTSEHRVEGELRRRIVLGDHDGELAQLRHREFVGPAAHRIGEANQPAPRIIMR
ncbi:hypothetical protein FF100_04050 [Methylobacterium terricola]|uniref:Uncharacterized protein n=1 Tax=Methylobacterium terricola TaxID=2583531 RepID=A0A5C4LRH3_9HYPH|nr:hypothetical protein FF100_04050 [Methylobacterium terricola]